MAGFSILAKLGLDSSKFASSLKSQDTAMSNFGKSIGTAVKAGAAIAGAAFAAFTIKGIKDMIEFEKSISEVFTLMPGITEESMASMSDSVRKLSTTMGVDLGDATAALYQAISAGVPQDNVFEFMEVAAKASVGGVTSLETAVDGITTAINTYGSANLSAKDAADSMFTAVKLGKTTFDELSDALFNVLPIAKQAGVG
jgi:TP901 family phage tail tape measure protein